MPTTDDSDQFNRSASTYQKYLPSYGAYGGAIGYGLDRLAVKKFGASGTSLTGAGIGAGIGFQYFGPIGGLFGAAAGSTAQQLKGNFENPGDTPLFQTTGSSGPAPLVGYLPVPTEWIPGARFTISDIPKLPSKLFGLFG